MIHDENLEKDLQVKSIQTGTEYLDKVEAVLLRLLGMTFDRNMPREVVEVVTRLESAYNLAWATRRFPLFDLAAFGQMEKRNMKVEVRSQNGYGQNDTISLVEMDLWVPLFAVSHVQDPGFMRDPQNYNQVQWSPESEDYIHGVKLDGNCIKENRDEISRKKKDRNSYNSISLMTKPPVVPQYVRTKVSHIYPKFQSTGLVWKAQWDATTKPGQPLILGQIGVQWFVIDRFDPSSIDGYIVNQFTK